MLRVKSKNCTITVDTNDVTTVSELKTYIGNITNTDANLIKLWTTDSIVENDKILCCCEDVIFCGIEYPTKIKELLNYEYLRLIRKR